jgi:hypothetical protein
MGAKKKKPQAISLDEFNKQQAQKQKPNDGGLAEILEGKKKQPAKPTKAEDDDMLPGGVRENDDHQFEKLKQKDVFGLESSNRPLPVPVKNAKKEKEVETALPEGLPVFPLLPEESKKEEKFVSLPFENKPKTVDIDGFQMQESRAQKKERKIQEASTKIYNEAPKSRAKGKVKTITFIPQ